MRTTSQMTSESITKKLNTIVIIMCELLYLPRVFTFTAIRKLEAKIYYMLLSGALCHGFE
jgi:hypothetical protein